MKRRWISSPRAQQRELRVDDRAVHGLGDLDEAHRAVEGDDRHARPRAARRPPAPGPRASSSPARRPARPCPCSTSDAVQAAWCAASSPAPSPVVSTSSPPLSRSSGSGISITCAQRISRSSAPSPITTSGSARRTTGRSNTSARLSMTLCHASLRNIRPTVHCGVLIVTGRVGNGQTEGARVAATQAEADIHLEGVTQALRRHDGGRRPHAVDPARELLRDARPVGLRQDDDAADDRRVRGPDRRAASSSAAPTSPSTRPTSATSTPSSSPTRSSRT